MSNTILNLYKGDYTQSEVATLCRTDGNVVFDNNTKRVYAGYDVANNKAVVYGSNVDDVAWNASNSTLTIRYADGTSQNVSLASFEDVNNKVTSISSQSTDAQYPSAKAVYDIVGDINSVLETIVGQNS